MKTSKATKNAYLEKLTEKIKMNSVEVGKELSQGLCRSYDGSSAWRHLYHGLSRAVDCQ